MVHRILLVRFSSLGDIVLTSPVVRAVRTRYAGADITFVTKAVWAPIVERMPGVDRVVGLAEGESVRALARRLGSAFDYRVDLHGSLRSAGLRLMVRGAWGVVRGEWLRRQWMAWRHLNEPALVPVVERYLLAAREAGLDVAVDGLPAGIQPTPADRAVAAHIVEGDYVVLCPGAAHANKRWPMDHWRALADTFGGVLVATGTEGERARLPGRVIDAFGLALGPTAALLAGARCVIAHDSGLMHLATAVATPVVALFGATSPALGYAPYRAVHRVVERQLACRPCSTHGGPRCPLGHHACLRGLDPALVARAARELVA